MMEPTVIQTADKVFGCQDFLRGGVGMFSCDIRVAYIRLYIHYTSSGIYAAIV